MKDNTKKIFYDVLGICVIASILGLMFNLFNSKGIETIRQPEVIQYSAENEIFTNTQATDHSSDALANNSVDGENTSTNATDNKDSIRLAKLRIQDSLKKVAEIAAQNQKQNSNDGIDKSGYKNVNKDFVKKHLNDSRIVIIDARNDIEYNKGHIRKAINIDPHQSDQNNFFNTIMTLSREKIYIIYCTGGMCDLSHLVYDAMKNFGFSNLYIFPGGWEEWTGK